MILNRQAAHSYCRCDICGKEDYWNHEWSWFGSIAHIETCPKQVPTVCSDECREKASDKIASGEWTLPKLVNRGYYSEVTQQKEGY